MPTAEFSLADYRAASDLILSKTTQHPTIGLILGSGMGAFAETIENPDFIPYDTIPHWPYSQVMGHHNRLVIGNLYGHTILAQQGRSHFYEGWSPAQVTFPVRVMHLLGIHTLIVTNAAGGINRDFRAGDLMLISDHLNFLGMAGFNPLRGPNENAFGVRFPDMTRPYDRELRAVARGVAAASNLTLREGVYAGLSGPNFETPAEIRMLRAVGADAVGMSTVGEVLIARHCGMRILGISGISNVCVDSEESTTTTTHEEVMEAGKTLVPKLITVLRGVLEAL